MSGMCGFMRKLRWSLGDFGALSQTHGCWDSGVSYPLLGAKRKGSSIYPPCVYTDDPNFGPHYGEGCEKYGLCSFYFHGVLHELFLREMDDATIPLYSKGDFVVFERPSGTILHGTVCQVDRRRGSEGQYYESPWTYDILAKSYDSIGECEKGMCLFKHIPEWSVYYDDYANDEVESC